jgi:ankyrin repeat protein
MKKSIPLVLLAVLVVTSQADTFQNIEELNEKLRGAVNSSDVNEVKKLIKAGADANHKFDLGRVKGITPLFLTCLPFVSGKSVDRAEIVQALIDAGANVNEKHKGMTVLHLAVQYGGDKAVIEPLVANGFDINSRNYSEQTPLYGAAFHKRIEWIDALIKNGADVNAGELRGKSPLHLAAREHYMEVAERLIANGADVNAKTKGGETPLDLVRFIDHKDMADILRKHGGFMREGIDGNKAPLKNPLPL